MASQQLSEFAGYAGLIVALIGIFPRMMSVWSRNKALASRGDVVRFESLMKAQDSLLEDCRQDCDKLQKEIERVKEELRQERNDRVREREHFYIQVTRQNQMIYECEGILRRHGWKDPRSVKREGGVGGV